MFHGKKRVAQNFIHWIAISRVTNVLAERNSYHSVYKLQGAAAAEHPTPKGDPGHKRWFQRETL